MLAHSTVSKTTIKMLMFAGMAVFRQCSPSTSLKVYFPLNISHILQNGAIMFNCYAFFRQLGWPLVHTLYLRTEVGLQLMIIFIIHENIY